MVPLLKVLVPALLALACLVAVAPSASAGSGCEVVVHGIGFICYGESWCDTDSGICSQQICVNPATGICILDPPN